MEPNGTINRKLSIREKVNKKPISVKNIKKMLPEILDQMRISYNTELLQTMNKIIDLLVKERNRTFALSELKNEIDSDSDGVMEAAEDLEIAGIAIKKLGEQEHFFSLKNTWKELLIAGDDETTDKPVEITQEEISIPEIDANKPEITAVNAAPGGEDAKQETIENQTGLNPSDLTVLNFIIPEKLPSEIKPIIDTEKISPLLDEQLEKYRNKKIHPDRLNFLKKILLLVYKNGEQGISRENLHEELAYRFSDLDGSLDLLRQMGLITPRKDQLYKQYKIIRPLIELQEQKPEKAATFPSTTLKPSERLPGTVLIDNTKPFIVVIKILKDLKQVHLNGLGIEIVCQKASKEIDHKKALKTIRGLLKDRAVEKIFSANTFENSAIALAGNWEKVIDKSLMIG